MLDGLVNACSERDGQQIKSWLNSPFIKFLDVEFAILAKSLIEKWIVVESVSYKIYLLFNISMLLQMVYVYYLTFRKKKPTILLKIMKMVQKSRKQTLEEAFVETEFLILLCIASFIQISV